MDEGFDVFQMYINEMAAIRACDAEENARLALRAARGDENVKRRLIEGNLKYVLELSRGYAGSGVPVPDLVQEANMALLLAVEEYEPEVEESGAGTEGCEQEVSGRDAAADGGEKRISTAEASGRDAAAGGGEKSISAAGKSMSVAGKSTAGARPSAGEERAIAGHFENFLAGRVRAALQAAVEEHRTQSRVGLKVLERVNLLQDVSKRMAEDLGREATVQELAEELRMTEDEVKEIMKTAMDALKVLGE